MVLNNPRQLFKDVQTAEAKRSRAGKKAYAHGGFSGIVPELRLSLDQWKGGYPMKVSAMNGSPGKEGNTYPLITHVLKEIESEGTETEIIQLAGKKIHGCISCYKCFA